MNKEKKDLVEYIEQSLLSAALAMFESEEWGDGSKEERVKIITQMLQASARNVASYTRLEE